MSAVDDALARLREHSDPSVLADMGPRYGIHTDRALGVRMADMKQLARQLGADHQLALDLWATGWYEARTVAGLVDEPAQVLHDRAADDRRFVDALPLVAQHAGDDRHLVNTAVTMALKAVANKRPALAGEVGALARRLAEADDAPPRRVGRATLAELAKHAR